MIDTKRTGTTFGQYLRDQRDSRNWTQAHLGEQSGVAQSTVAAYEKGDSLPSHKSFIALADAFVWDDRARFRAFQLWSQPSTDWAAKLGLEDFDVAYLEAKRCCHTGRPHDALKYAHAAVALARTELQRGRAAALQAAAAQPRGDYEAAEFYHRRSMRSLNGDVEEQGVAMTNIAEMYRLQEMYPLAMSLARDLTNSPYPRVSLFARLVLALTLLDSKSKELDQVIQLLEQTKAGYETVVPNAGLSSWAEVWLAYTLTLRSQSFDEGVARLRIAAQESGALVNGRVLDPTNFGYACLFIYYAKGEMKALAAAKETAEVHELHDLRRRTEKEGI